MRFTKRSVLAVAVALLLVAVPAAGAAGFTLDTTADQYPKTYHHEDQLTIASHDRASMDWLEYENDNGNIATIDATVNGTNDSAAKVSYRADQLEDESLGMFPRVDNEENNTVTWLNEGNWTTSAGNVTASGADGTTASGVKAIQIGSDGTFGSGSSDYTEYTKPSITSDAPKRYLQFVGNVDSLEAGAEVQIQVRDGGGDYVRAVINSSRDDTATDVIANGTHDGVIYQEQLGQLTVKGSGDGTLDAVETVRVQVVDGDANVTITGLNVQKKSQWSFGNERVLDTSTDDDDDYTDEVVHANADGGRINMTDTSGLSQAFDDAVIHDLRYHNVEYRMQDNPGDVTVEFVEANEYGGYPMMLKVGWTSTIPAAYDITHGNIELRVEQSFLSDRYTRLRYAEGIGDKDPDEIADSSWIDVTGNLGEQHTTITADSTVSADKTYRVELNALLVDGDQANLEIQKAGGGFWGDSGGGNPFMSLYNWVAGGIVGLVTMIAAKMRLGTDPR